MPPDRQVPRLPSSHDSAPLDLDYLRSAPKVLLHDHLDGGPAGHRRGTCRRMRYNGLPAETPDGLAAWFRNAADSGSLELYLETFAHTVAVMQTPSSAPGRARVRGGPEPTTRRGLRGVRFAPETASRGRTEPRRRRRARPRRFPGGEENARADGREIRVGCLLTAMRHAARSREIAELAVRFATAVCRFDIAGAEAGYPRAGISTPSSTCARPTRISRSTPARRSGCRRSTRRSRSAEPIGWGRGAHHRRHVVGPDGEITLGLLANYVRATSGSRSSCSRARTCRPVRSPTSRSIRSICSRRLRFGFRAPSTDNRLMSDSTDDREMLRWSTRSATGWSDLERFTTTTR